MEKVLNVVNKKEIQTDYAYWQQKSVQDRIDAVEILRLQYLQMQEDVQQGLQRVYRIVKRK